MGPAGRERWHYPTCFVTGGVILVLEVLGFRLFAPFFGYSVYVSGTLIGVILLFMAGGYFLGGRLADRRPREETMFATILAAAGYLVLVYLVYDPLLGRFQRWGPVAGTVAAAVVVFAAPMTLLSMVSPFLVKLVSRREQVGAGAGTVFAVSTMGSILGTFLATFLLIPELGSRRTLALCVVLLLAVALAGLASARRRLLPFGALGLGLLLPPATTAEPGLVHEEESFYNLIRIYDDGGTRVMVLNSPAWRQSYRPDLGRLRETYREYFNLAPYLAEVRDVLILGLSAGASALELRHFFDVRIDAVEIDPAVVRLAGEYFGVREDERLRIHTGDAKTFLTYSGRRYDFTEIDLFHGGPEIPFYVATREFFLQVREHATEEGVVMMNLLGGSGRSPKNLLVDAVAATAAAVFPSVFLLDLGGNTLLVATRRETTLEAIRERLGRVGRPELAPLAARMARELTRYAARPGAQVLTDDRAPLERITRRVVAALE